MNRARRRAAPRATRHAKRESSAEEIHELRKRISADLLLLVLRSEADGATADAIGLMTVAWLALNDDFDAVAKTLGGGPLDPKGLAGVLTLDGGPLDLRGEGASP